MRKKPSLVLNDGPSHHGPMNTNQNTSQNASRSRRLRAFVRYAWGDHVAAHRALLRVPPYDSYLIDRRGR